MGSKIDFGNTSSTNNSDSGSNTNDDEVAATIRGPVYGFSQDESQLPVPSDNYGQRLPQFQNFMGPVGPSGLDQSTVTWADAMRNYAEMSSKDPDSFRNLQAQLYAGGFYDKYLTASKGELPKFGRMDADTVSALHDAISEAVGTGTSVRSVLDNAATSAQQAAATNKPTRLTNPDVVRANAQKVAESTIGKDLSGEALDRIQNNAEALAQTSYTDSNGATTYYGGTPDQNWLADQIQQLMPQATAAYNTAQNTGQLLKMIDTQGLFSAYHQ